MKTCFAWLAFLSLFISATSHAESLILPLQLDYGLIKKFVVEQLLPGAEHSAVLWRDKADCSRLTLSNPQIGGQNGQIRLQNAIAAQLGTPFGGQCIPLLQWAGTLETWQRPTLSQDRSQLSLPITRVTAYDRQGNPLNIAKLQELIKSVVEPKLTGLKIDLNKSRADIERSLSRYVPQQSTEALKTLVSSLRFNDIQAGDDDIAVKLAFEAPNGYQPLPAAAPLTAAEQQQWRILWQNWHGFLTNAIEQASRDSQSQSLRTTLTSILQDSQRAFEAGLTAQVTGGDDPIRAFFTRTWERLAPVLRVLAKQLPEAKSVQYLTFISATDIIYQLDAIGSPFGLGISADGLRHLVRLLIADQQSNSKIPG